MLNKFKIPSQIITLILCSFFMTSVLEAFEKDTEDFLKQSSFFLSNCWHTTNDAILINGSLEGPESWIGHPVIIFDLSISKPFPRNTGAPYKIMSFALVSLGPITGLCKVQPYSINPSNVESFSCDGDQIKFRWGGYDVEIVKGEKLDSNQNKCHIIFSYRFFDLTKKVWIERKWTSVDGIKLGEVLLR